MSNGYNLQRVHLTTDVRAASARPELFGDRFAALLEWYGRREIRGRLLALSDRELHDIGISRGEIDYVASNPDIDPRGGSLAK